MKTQIAKLNYFKIAPRKVRLVANVIKGLSINEAEAQLLINPKRPSEALLKLLRSAVSSAKNNQLDPEKLFIKEIRVDQGPMQKRWIPRAQGRATPIQKKSSHILLVLAESEKIKTPRFKISKPQRIKKSQLEKMKKEEEKHKHEHEEAEVKKEIKQKGKPGFVKRMFGRKAI